MPAAAELLDAPGNSIGDSSVKPTKTVPSPPDSSSVGTSTSDLETGDLNAFYRFILYGLCGVSVEVAFTASWQVIEQGNRKLHGITSIYAFFIYGLCSLVVERLYLRLYMYPWYSRGLAYLICTYSWEFSTGLFLRQFNACPWDYEPYFKGHIMGLITMEYAPLWYVGTMFEERFIIKNALRLSWNLGEKKKTD